MTKDTDAGRVAPLPTGREEREAVVACTDFVCAICGRKTTHMRWNRRGPGEVIPPICGSCERYYSEGSGKPAGGSFRDRRYVAQGYALAEALVGEANKIKWRAEAYGRA